MKPTNNYVSQRIAMWMLSKGAISFSDRFGSSVIRYIKHEGVDYKMNEKTFKLVRQFIKPNPNQI